jgi:hypothetical protein
VYKSATGATVYAQNNANNAAGKCVVCPPAPAPATTTSSTPPGVIYQPCGSSNFAAGGVAKPLPNSGTFTGQAYCASVPNSPAFWVGDGLECVAMPWRDPPATLTRV